MASIYGSTFGGMSSIGLGDAAFMASCANICSSAGSDSYGIDQYMAATSYGGMFAPAGASSFGLFGDSSRYTSALQDTPMGTFGAWNGQGAIAFDGACFCVTGQGMGTGAVGGGGAGTGAGGAGAAGGPNINAGTGADGADEAGEATAKPIEQTTIDDAVSKLVELGYSDESVDGKPSEAQAIIDRIEAEAREDNPDNPESAFRSLLSKVPAKSETNDETGEVTPCEGWTESFGNWYARYILDMGAMQARDYVHGSEAFRAEAELTAPPSSGSLSGVPFVKLTQTAETAQIDTGNGEQTEAKVFTVQAGGSIPQLPEGTRIYRTGTSGHYQYYREVNGQFEALPFRVSNSKYYLNVGADPNDFATIHAPVSGSSAVTANGKSYTIYEMEDPAADNGKAQSLYGQTEGDSHRIYCDRDGKWYRKNGEAYDLLPEAQPEFDAATGRLSFGGDAEWAVNDGYSAEEYDARSYMDMLDKHAQQARDTTAAQGTSEDAQSKARVEAVVERWLDTFETPNDRAIAAKMHFEVNDDGTRLDITCDEADAQALHDLFMRNGNLEDLNALFGDLGPNSGIKIYLNDQQITGSQDTRATKISDKLEDMAEGATPPAETEGEETAGAAAAVAEDSAVGYLGSATQPAAMTVTPTIHGFTQTFGVDDAVGYIANLVGTRRGDISTAATSLDLTVALPAEFAVTGQATDLRNAEQQIIDEIKEQIPGFTGEITIHWTQAQDGDTAASIAAQASEELQAASGSLSALFGSSVTVTADSGIIEIEADSRVTLNQSRKNQLRDILFSLPAGTRVYLNGQEITGSAQERMTAIFNALKALPASNNGNPHPPAPAPAVAEAEGTTANPPPSVSAAIPAAPGAFAAPNASSGISGILCYDSQSNRYIASSDSTQTPQSGYWWDGSSWKPIVDGVLA